MKLAMQVGLGPGRIVLDGDPASRLQFSAHICCGQMSRLIKLPLGREVGLNPSDFVLDGDPVPFPQKGAEPPNFRPISVVAKWLDGSRCHLVGR